MTYQFRTEPVPLALVAITFLEARLSEEGNNWNGSILLKIYQRKCPEAWR